MGAFLAGLGITIVTFFVVFATVVACAGIIAIIRAAINDSLGAAGKVIWILLCLCLPGAAFFYFAFVDKNAFLKFVGWACILMIAFASLTGGAAFRSGWDMLKNHPMDFYMNCYEGPEKDNIRGLPRCNIIKKSPAPHKPSAPSPVQEHDDGSLSL